MASQVCSDRGEWLVHTTISLEILLPPNYDFMSQDFVTIRALPLLCLMRRLIEGNGLSHTQRSSRDQQQDAF